jgi:xylose isomerase
MAGEFRFTFGPWNIHEGADPFGPEVRPSLSFAEKLEQYKQLGYDGVQFHDDDAVPDMEDLSADEMISAAAEMKNLLDDAGLVPEFVAPRLWEDPRGADGGYTSNDPAVRQWARERSLRAIDIANALGTQLIVLWLAREGTYLREAKDSRRSVELLVEALNEMLEYDDGIKIAIEPKPNEPMDHAYLPTMGHAIGLSYLTVDPGRVGTVMESAHSILAGLDPSDEMGFAIAHDKLWSVHLNAQNGLKFDQDRAFGTVDLRRAFNQVRVLDQNDYGRNGEMVGMDVKAIRTQKDADATKHLRNSREIFLRLLEISRGLDQSKIEQLRAARDYEELDMYILTQLMGG